MCGLVVTRRIIVMRCMKVKSESAERGYMTQEEIGEHLIGIGTTNARIAYLKDILSKENLLSEETRRNTYSLFAKNLRKAWRRPGHSKEAKRQFYGDVADALEKSEEYEKLGHLLEHNRDYIFAIRTYREAHLEEDELRAITKWLNEGGYHDFVCPASAMDYNTRLRKRKMELEKKLLK